MSFGASSLWWRVTNVEARRHAEDLVNYFGRVAHENSQEVWRKGLSTAQEWLRLIDAENVSQAELSKFIGIVHANRFRSSGWHDLALGAYNWVLAKGSPVPPVEEFFHRPVLPGKRDLATTTPLEHAHKLLSIFEQYNREDSDSQAWIVGVQTMREWLRLIEGREAEKSETMALVRSVFENRLQFLGPEWFDTALALSKWCKANGHSDLIPDDFRSLMDKD